MTPMEISENAGRLQVLDRLRRDFSPVQFAILTEASQTGTGWLKLGTGLVYDVDGEPTVTYLNQANTRSLRKKGVVEETFFMNGLKKEITGIKLTRRGLRVVEEIVDALKAVPFSEAR